MPTDWARNWLRAIRQARYPPKPFYRDGFLELPAELQLKIVSYAGAATLRNLRKAYPSEAYPKAMILTDATLATVYGLIGRYSNLGRRDMGQQLLHVLEHIQYLTPEQVNVAVIDWHMQSNPQRVIDLAFVAEMMRILASRWHLPQASDVIAWFINYVKTGLPRSWELIDLSDNFVVRCHFSTTNRHPDLEAEVCIENLELIGTIASHDAYDYWEESTDRARLRKVGEILDVMQFHLEDGAHNINEVQERLLAFPLSERAAIDVFQELVHDRADPDSDNYFVDIDFLRRFIERHDLPITCCPTGNIRVLRVLLSIGLPIPLKNQSAQWFFNFLDQEFTSEGRDELDAFLDLLNLLVPFKQWSSDYVWCIQEWQLSMFEAKGMTPRMQDLYYLVQLRLSDDHSLNTYNCSTVRPLLTWLLDHIPAVGWRLAIDSSFQDLFSMLTGSIDRQYNTHEPHITNKSLWSAVEYLVDNAECLSIRFTNPILLHWMAPGDYRSGGVLVPARDAIGRILERLPRTSREYRRLAEKLQQLL